MPFDILDFSEFLPLLTRHQSPLGRFQALVAYYGQDHGRFNIIPYGMLALKWSLFGWNATGWQLARFVQMSVIVVATYLLLLELRVSKVAGLFGALLFVTAGAASPAYLRLTMAEPLGTMFLLPASALAASYQRARHWRFSAVAIAVLLLATVLSKEMLVATVPFVMLLGCCRGSDSRFVAPKADRKSIWLLATTAAAIVCASIPIVSLALRAKSESFGGMYGRSPVSLRSILGNWFTFALVQPPVFLPDGVASFLVTNLIFLSIIIIGWRQLLRSPQDRRHFVTMMLIALSLPGCAALIYSPWPQPQLFYGLPFLLGGSILLAQAIVGIETTQPRGKWLCYIACGAVVAGTSASAHHATQVIYADRTIKFELGRELLRHPGQDSILYGVRRIPLVRWEGQGPTLRRYTMSVFATDSVPPIHDVTCRQLRALEARPASGITLASSTLQCGTLRGPTKVFRQGYRYLAWPIPSIRTDSVRTDLIVRRAPP